ncbi:MAG TPA: potassium-transporting ATPase subunit KdpC [Candidatus Kapabacteria bacterium]|nr:potassium-transporting ATPase subunit KdpC [Candidatus Kapabacteria bacterium]
MKTFITATLVTIVLTVLLGILYPLAMTGIAQIVFPDKANGSLVMVKDSIVGSSLLGQSFGSPKYFHSRPSAAGDGYDPMKSGGSNLGPTSKALYDRIKHDADSLRTLYPELKGDFPSDMLTTSGSGLDPDITLANALIQAPVVAKANNIAVEDVKKLVANKMKGRDLGFIGEPRINVLELNLALIRQIQSR